MGINLQDYFAAMYQSKISSPIGRKNESPRQSNMTAMDKFASGFLKRISLLNPMLREKATVAIEKRRRESATFDVTSEPTSNHLSPKAKKEPFGGNLVIDKSKGSNNKSKPRISTAV